VHCYFISDKRKRVELGSESSLADKDGDGYIEPFNVNPDEKNLGGTSDASVDLTDTEVYQETHYYPFGMTMEGEWQDIVNGPENNYLYNGKELNTDFGLDWSDYGARYYDAAIGRWGQVDPLASSYVSYSPYNYVANNPMKFIDPDGKQIGVKRTKRKNRRDKVTISYSGVLINNGSGLSNRKVRKLRRKISRKIRRSYKGKGGSIKWRTKVSLRIGSAPKAGDNVIEITNQQNPNLGNQTGLAPNGISALVDGRNRSLNSITKTAAHEVGHNMGLPHNLQESVPGEKVTMFGITTQKMRFMEENTIQPDNPAAGNMMLPGSQPNVAGSNITESQILHMEQDFNNNKLNGSMSGGDESWGTYPTDKPLIDINGNVTKQ